MAMDGPGYEAVKYDMIDQDSKHSSNTGNTSNEIIYECSHWTPSYAFSSADNVQR